MNAEKYQKIKRIFNLAAELPVVERENFLREFCESDAMRREVEKMLVFVGDDDGDELEKNAFEVFSGGTHNKIPEKIGVYKIIREIGRGGMGAVYEAVRENRDFTQKAALKVIKRGMDTDAILRRFRHEQKILASLTHPSIARFLDGGMTEDGLPFYAMEHVEGEFIDDYCRSKSLSVEEILKLFREVCAAVQYAHQNLVVHRDLKPKNILVTKDGVPKLLDFGIGKILTPDEEEIGTATQFGMMTPAYASPEQILGQRIGTTSDIYSLGVILYELLTGQKPYKINSKSQIDIEKSILETEPARPSSAFNSQTTAVVKHNKRQMASGEQNRRSQTANRKLLKGDLDNIILKSLRKEPSERYVSVGQFSEDIRRHLDGLPIIARPHTFSYRAAKFIKRNRVGVAAAAVVFLSLCAGITVAVWQADRAERQRVLAEKRFAEVRQLANSVVFKYHDAIADLQGSTAVREMLVKDALRYLDALAADAGDDNEFKKELALAYLKLGDVQGKAYAANVGDTEGALESYRKSVALFEEIVKSSPGDIFAKESLVKTYDNLALLLTRAGGSEQAQILQKALILNEELLKIEPENTAIQRQFVELQIRSGDLAAGFENNLREHLKALPLAEELVREDANNPEKTRTLIRVNQRVGTDYQRLGAAAEKQNEAEKAKEFYSRSLVFHRKMYEGARKLYEIEPEKSANYRYLALSAINLSESLSKNGEIEEAVRMLEKARGIIEEILRLDQKNSETKFDLSSVHEAFGAVYRTAKEFGKSAEHYRQSISLDENIYKTDSQKVEVLGRIRDSFNSLSEMSDALGDAEKAAFYRQESEETQAKLKKGKR